MVPETFLGKEFLLRPLVIAPQFSSFATCPAPRDTGMTVRGRPASGIALAAAPAREDSGISSRQGQGIWMPRTLEPEVFAGATRP